MGGSSGSSSQPSMEMPPPVPMNAQTFKFDTSGSLQPDTHQPFQQPDFSSFITALLAKSAANKGGPSWSGDTTNQQAAAYGQDTYQGGPAPEFRTDAVKHFSSGLEDPEKVAQLLMKSGADQLAQQQAANSKDASGVSTSHPLKASA